MQNNEVLSELADDPLLSDREIEVISNGLIKARTLRNWRSAGKYLDKLPTIKIGGRVYTRKSMVKKLLAEGII